MLITTLPIAALLIDEKMSWQRSPTLKPAMVTLPTIIVCYVKTATLLDDDVLDT